MSILYPTDGRRLRGVNTAIGAFRGDFYRGVVGELMKTSRVVYAVDYKGKG